MNEYRAEHLASFLRPAQVREAREAFREGSIGQAELAEAEDGAIREALAKQTQVGVDVYSDGEFRRTGFQNDFMDSVEGYVPAESPPVVRIWQGPGGPPQEQGISHVVGAKLRQLRRLTQDQVTFLKVNAPGPFKMTVPSPNQFPQLSFQSGVTDPHYADRSELLWDIAGIIKAELAALVNEGVPYVQVDAPRYSYYVDATWREHLRGLGQDPDAAFAEAVEADTFCFDGLRREGVTVALHICRGNNQSKWYAQGGYEPIAERVFGSLPVDRFLLEYDTERAGTFEPLRHVPTDKTVVLGLISTKDPTMESQDDLLRRIDEASRYVPIERLALSPQCGFASTAAGNLLSEDEQWRKLELVADTARKVW